MSTASRERKPNFFYNIAKNYPVVVIFIVLVILFSILYHERFLSPANLTATLRQFVTLILFSIGPTFVMLLGSMDQSFIGIWMLGSALLWILTPILGPISLLVFPLFGIASGLLIGLIHVKLRVPSFILTLSVLIVYWGLTVIIVQGNPRIVPGYEFLTADFIPFIPTPFLYSIVIILLAVFIVKRTKLGTYFYAIGSNEEGARLAGIDVGKYKIVAFTLSGFFSGIGSIVLFQHLGGTVPVSFSMNNVVRPLIAIILGGTPLSGGRGGPQRTILGALTFSVIYRGLYLSALDAEVIDLIVGLILIVSIVISSRGGELRGVEIA
jgi:ribose transport system permease protein